MILFVFLVLFAYLMGSICSAVLISKACGLPDPRTEGSKNPGATNVLRLAGKQYAALVMVADLLKGTIPVLIAKALGTDLSTIGFTAVAAVIGHMYPIFFQFKGGKGVATALGALLGLHFILGVMVAATWLLVAKFSRYSSLASIISMSLAPFYSLLLIHRLEIFIPLLVMTLFILYKHTHNINRLIDKTEPKIKLKQNMLNDIIEKPKTPAVPKSKPTVKKIPETTTKTIRNKTATSKKKPRTTPEANRTKAKPQEPE